LSIYGVIYSFLANIRLKLTINTLTKWILRVMMIIESWQDCAFCV